MRALLAIAAALLFAAGGGIAQERAQFTILHFGDIAEVEPLHPSGDLARIATIIAREKSEKSTVIVTHAGNALSPSFASAYDRGDHMTRLLNRMLVDVMVASNHEFDFGPDIALQRFRQLEFPVLSANALDGAARPAGLRGSSMVTVGRFKVAFIGATSADTATLSNPGRIRFAPMAAAVSAEADRVRAAGADLVVLLSAGDAAETVEAAAAARADIVLTENGAGAAMARFDGRRGHAASGLDGNLIVAVDVDVQRVRRDVGADVKVGQPGPDDSGEITVEPQRNVNVIEWRPAFRILDTRAYEPDQLIEIAVQVELDNATVGLGEIVGTVAPAISSARATVRTAESGVGSLIADAIRAYANAEVAFVNAGGIRGDRAYEADFQWRLRTIAEELPFANRVEVIRATGAQLRTALEHALADAPRESLRFLQVSGIALRYSAALPAGRRIVDLKIGGRPIQAARVYTVATSDFVARGGDGFAMLARLPRVAQAGEAPLLRDALAAYIRRSGTVRSIEANRIVAVAGR